MCFIMVNLEVDSFARLTQEHSSKSLMPLPFLQGQKQRFIVWPFTNEIDRR